MSSCVAYEEVDFVDYFARATNVSEVHLARIAEEPKCLAVIDAVVKTPMRLGIALWHVGDELDRLELSQSGGSPGLNGRKRQYPFGYIRLMKQVARRIELEVEDPRSFSVRPEIRHRFREFYEFSPMSELDFQVWLNRDAPFECPDRDLEEIWSTLKRRDVHEYLWHWQIAHTNVLEYLLNDRRFIAGLEASYAHKSGFSSDRIYGMIDEIGASRIRDLNTTFRFMLYGRLAERIAMGLMRVPTGLRVEFPEYYDASNSDV